MFLIYHHLFSFIINLFILLYFMHMYNNRTQIKILLMIKLYKKLHFKYSSHKSCIQK